MKIGLTVLVTIPMSGGLALVGRVTGNLPSGEVIIETPNCGSFVRRNPAIFYGR